MEMCYDGALVMPSNYVGLEEDEMMYIVGGIFISYATMVRAISLIGRTVNAVRKCGSVSAAVLMCKKAYLTAELAFTLYWHSIPGWGQVAILFGACVGGIMIGVAARAVFSGKGVEITLSHGIKYK